MTRPGQTRRGAPVAMLVLWSCAPPPAPAEPVAPPGASSTTAAPRPSASPVAGVTPGRRLTFEAARRLFTERGVQPDQTLPALTLVDLHGEPADLAALRGDRPLLLVTCSLTCNIARRRQADVEELQTRFGDRLAVVMVYTIEAHPQGDPSPYTGDEWVPPDNHADGVLVRQPGTLADRLALARRYREGWAKTATLLVDAIGDAGWQRLGQAPNVGLLVDRAGIVRLRQGWFEPQAMAAAIERLLP